MFEATFDFILGTELRSLILDGSAGCLNFRLEYPPESWLPKDARFERWVLW